MLNGYNFKFQFILDIYEINVSMETYQIKKNILKICRRAKLDDLDFPSFLEDFGSDKSCTLDPAE